MTIPQLLVHAHHDNVGVVVVEDLAPGTDMLAVITEDNSDFRITAKQAAPIGHKIALKDLAVGDTVIEQLTPGATDWQVLMTVKSVASGPVKAGVKLNVVLPTLYMLTIPLWEEFGTNSEAGIG